MGKFILPQIKSVIINDFSLYKQRDQIKLNINEGVFCLAGANGLGKSTFISILSYALMGIVVNPKKRFSSINRIPQFFKESEKFASTYFKGRINETKRDSASVEITFQIGNMLYSLKRLFFDNSGLQHFSRKNIEDNTETIDLNNSSSTLLEIYKHFFIKDVKLDSFEQFSFIHAFVLTFDESKQLLFWEESLMNRVIFMFFGVDPQEAEKADDLRKDIARHGSNMRNLQWEITRNTRELNELLKSSEKHSQNEDDIEKILQEYEDLENKLIEIHEHLDSNKNELKQTLVIISDRSLRMSDLKNQYEIEFNNIYTFNNIPIEKDSKIIDILRQITTKVIGNKDISEDIQILKKRIKEIGDQHKNNPNSIEHLKEIDKQIQKHESELKENYAKKERLDKESSEYQEQKIKTLQSLEKFKEDHELTLKKASEYQNKSNLSQEIDGLKNLINKKEIQKENETKLRNSKTKELETIESKIKDNYHMAKEKFIPIFKEYANNFLGLDIDVDFRRGENGLSLILKVNDTERTEKYQLSESQRYFIDIALRFALIEYVSSQAYILIDTPEGSLDIAYETRAGKMFADFVLKGYDVIMTANINSSQLLLQMAKKCGNSQMHLERMTNWTILSIVQQEEHEVIENAFNKIEETLSAYNA